MGRVRIKLSSQNQIASKPEKKETRMETLSSMAMVLATALFIITFNIQAFEIPTSSMENTLLVGDHVFVDRITTAPSASGRPSSTAVPFSAATSSSSTLSRRLTCIW